MISWVQSFDILRFVGFHPFDALQAVDTMHSAIVDSAGSGFKRSFEVIWRLWNYDLLGLIEKMHGVIHLYIYIIKGSLDEKLPSYELLKMLKNQ